ncbi:MAG: peptide chain release factor N(5)-glutamine methyltransferase [bacterium]|nr:peptide chain release factor N(5)-glutamine methyltransferase [bacterium]
MTVKDLLSHSGLQALDAEIMLAFVLRRPRSWLLAHPDESVSAAAARRFTALAKRRLEDVPVAYLVGYKEFYGRKFAVSEDVLCPRPDTETLVERVLAVLAPGDAVYDVGTGSGCVGITVALERPDVSLTLTDVSEAALKAARRNARRLGAKVRFILADGLPEAVSDAKPDRLVILSNPPYLGATDTLPPFEPREALEGGPDGLDVIRRIVEQLRQRKISPRHLLLEHGESQGAAVRKLVGSRAETYPDLAGKDRITGY